MKVIPVIDVLNGIVVHAVRGKRHEYQPLQSIITDSTQPLDVAKTLKMLGFDELYVADLDAITKGKSNFQMLKKIVAETGLKLMVDAGTADLKTARKLLDTGVSKIVVGTETLSSKNFVGEAVRLFGSERVTVSLDLKGGKILTKSEFEGSTNPLRLLGEFQDLDVIEVIILDLARVGSGEGVDLDFLKKIQAEVQFDLIVGGGIRDIKDLVKLDELGVSGVLVATALHSGKISILEIKKAGFL